MPARAKRPAAQNASGAKTVPGRADDARASTPKAGPHKPRPAPSSATDSGSRKPTLKLGGQSSPKARGDGARGAARNTDAAETGNQRPNASKRPRPGHRSARAKPSGKPAPTGPKTPMRIAKAIARAGLCSRRDAERWIEEGRVKINGETLSTPAREVGPNDHILVDGEPLPQPEPPRLWRFHKPKGQVTSHRDPEGRPTVFDNLPAHLPRVISVGRLDFNTEGLLLLTTDGDLARYLELPETGWLRRYRVRAFGRVTQADLDALSDGITIEGVKYGPIEATLDSINGQNVWLTVGLREGKNREVRRILESLALQVNRLIRVSYGPFQLTSLKPGEAEIVRRKVLIEQLGQTLADQFGITEPVEAPPPRKPSDSKSAPARRPPRPGKPPTNARASDRKDNAAPRGKPGTGTRKPSARPRKAAGPKARPKSTP